MDCNNMNGTKLNPALLATLLAGEHKTNGAPFTVVSNATGKDYTFKLNRAQYNGKWYSHVMVEAGYLEFKYLGFYTGKAIIYKKYVNETPAAIAATWLLNRIVTGGDLSAVTLYHTGRCLKCGRELTDANSIELGIGPTCAMKY